MSSEHHCDVRSHPWLTWIMASERRQVKAGITLVLMGTLVLATVLL